MAPIHKKARAVNQLYRMKSKMNLPPRRVPSPIPFTAEAFDWHRESMMHATDLPKRSSSVDWYLAAQSRYFNEICNSWLGLNEMAEDEPDVCQTGTGEEHDTSVQEEDQNIFLCGRQGIITPEKEAANVTIHWADVPVTNEKAILFDEYFHKGCERSGGSGGTDKEDEELRLLDSILLEDKMEIKNKKENVSILRLNRENFHNRDFSEDSASVSALLVSFTELEHGTSEHLTGSDSTLSESPDSERDFSSNDGSFYKESDCTEFPASSCTSPTKPKSRPAIQAFVPDEGTDTDLDYDEDVLCISAADDDYLLP